MGNEIECFAQIKSFVCYKVARRFIFDYVYMYGFRGTVDRSRSF